MKKWSIILASLAILLSDVMCAVAASSYTGMLWGIQYEGYSAPACVSLLNAIPFAAAITGCIALAVFFRKQANKTGR